MRFAQSRRHDPGPFPMPGSGRGAEAPLPATPRGQQGSALTLDGLDGLLLSYL